MCNLYTQTRAVEAVRQAVRALQMPIRFPEGIPNLSPRDICITDPAPILRRSPEEPDSYDLVVRRWSWPGPGGKPVYNFRSEGREFGSGRCLIIADGFYEFTAPADPKAKRKDRWLFTSPDDGMLGIAGLVRSTPDVGEAFTMLTTEPGPDVAPYHNRQVAVLPPGDWKAWLDGSVAARDLLKPLPEGTLTVRPSLR
ncbi:MAG TPA: SOS response-associated peptidase [Sphingomicrobium sp.]|nr:SOS response-associated peptidase [Sphingomicrobium sp.]